MSNEEMIVALNTVVEALGRHDLEIILADNKRLREENERLKDKVKELEKFSADMIVQATCARERGAAEMLEFIDSRKCEAWRSNEAILERFKVWREGRGNELR